MPEEETNKGILEQMSLQDRLDCKAIYRCLQTKDGAAMLHAIKRRIGYDDAGPAYSKERDEEPQRCEWLGQRRCVWAIQEMAAMGKRLLATDDDTHNPNPTGNKKPRVTK